jgi:predicted NBD/HSP70 family sugar kinase
MNGLNHRDMSETNKYVLLKYLATHQQLSRLDLSRLTGLSKMTITAIIGEYLEKGIVRECGQSVSTGGRKATLLEIDPTALLTLGICIGREYMQVGIVNLRGNVLDEETVPFSSIGSTADFLNSLFYLCDRMLERPYHDRIWGMGVSCAGPLSIRQGKVLNPPDFHHIHDVEIVAELQNRYALPTYLQNDMCVAALAEAYFGHGQSYRDFLYVGVGAGIGGGVILDQKLYTGAVGLAGAIGHSIVERDGMPCECGQRGCLEQYASTKAVLQWAREQSGNASLSWMELANGAEMGDDLSLRALDRMTDYLSMALINAQIVLDMPCVILGGELYRAKSYVVERMREKMQDPCLQWVSRRKVQVEGSSFVGNAAFIGTTVLVMENNLEPGR